MLACTGGANHNHTLSAFLKYSNAPSGESEFRLEIPKSNLGKYLACSLFVLAGGVSPRYFRMNAM